jgi:ABC-type transporter Mla subunit MlaD
MQWIGWTLEGIVMLLLAAALPLVLRLERALAAVRRDRGALDGSATHLAEATRLAEAASLRLRATVESAGRQVADRLAAAEPVRDDLRYLVERAESMADRLEGLVRAARPSLAEAPAAVPAARPAGQSQAERDLLRALVRGLPGMPR